MAQYSISGYQRARERFRANRNPGPGVVQGLGRLGSIQQVLWYPVVEGNARMIFRCDPQNSERLLLDSYSRRGRLQNSRIAMDSISTSGYDRTVRRIRKISHLATTSTYAERLSVVLAAGEWEKLEASLDSEADRYRTQGVTGIISMGESASHHTIGRQKLAMSELYVHGQASISARGKSVHRPPAVTMLNPTNFDLGAGVGAHAYEGAGRQPLSSRAYSFPLGQNPEDTMDIYQELLGKRRGLNIVVKEMMQDGVSRMLVLNGSGEPA